MHGSKQILGEERHGGVDDVWVAYTLLGTSGECRAEGFRAGGEQPLQVLERGAGRLAG